MSTVARSLEAPLAEHLGREVDASQVEGLTRSISVSEITRLPTKDVSSSHLRYQVGVNGATQAVELWIWELSDQQRRASHIALNQSGHELHEIKVGGRSFALRRHESQEGLHIAEYVAGSRRYQLSTSAPQGDELLRDIARVIITESPK